MRIHFRCLCFCLSSFFLTGCILCHAAPDKAAPAGSQKGSEPQKKATLSYRLTVPSMAPISQGTPVLVHVTWKNNSTKTLGFRNRGVGMFQFQITDQSGQVVPLSSYGKGLLLPRQYSSEIAKVFALESDSGVIDQLLPGQDASWDVNVSELYTMNGLGTYRIILAKSNLTTGFYTPSDVESNTITINIVKKADS